MRTTNMNMRQACDVAALLSEKSSDLQDDYDGAINYGGCGIWALHFSNLLLSFGYSSKIREKFSDVEYEEIITDTNWFCNHLLVDLMCSDTQYNVDCEGFGRGGRLSEVPRSLIKYSLTQEVWNSQFVKGGSYILDMNNFRGNPMTDEMEAREVLDKHMALRMNELYVPELKKILWR